ncbi:MAG: phosphoribosyl-AMP cyclohydrolase [[Candidatus Thermochlorobacteriaceae] bacterium GBChlB]|nr:MAG: phosphoribosyl-AMP cyclohydrolase [[Candidatus Thermochlorobacteriaceae] bacterium GBChlB]
MATNTPTTSIDFLDNVKFDKEGLVAAIAQDAETNKVLMLAYMNRESLEITLRDKKACYWSRSRKELWLKGATSGNYQEVKEILLDCDGDAIVLKIKQTGGACHTGYESCFYRRVDANNQLEICDQIVYDAESAYAKK